jgi:hypothetical protein
MNRHIHQRLKNLTATFGSQHSRSFTHEDLCWEYWRQDKRGFLALANGDCRCLRVFVDLFQHRDTGSVTVQARASARGRIAVRKSAGQEGL